MATVCILLAALVLGGNVAASAQTTPCNDEPVQDGDVWVNVSGVLFVGFDAPEASGGVPNVTAVCFATGGPLEEGSESFIVSTADPSPGEAGATASADQQSCEPDGLGGEQCQTAPLLGATGAEAGSLGSTSTNGPLDGDAVVGATQTYNGPCAWSDGAQVSPVCGAPVVATASSAAEGDGASAEQGSGCLLDVDHGALPGCEVQGWEVRSGQNGQPTLFVFVTGMPQPIVVDLPPLCVGLGTVCS